MQKETCFMALCIEVANGQVFGNKFTRLLLETGVYLDEVEWDTAGRLLGKSDQILSTLETPTTVH